ncbi:MAG: helicase-related protein, partial [Armatimonadota bacterium]
SGWQPREIVSDKVKLFHQARRVQVETLEDDTPLSWEELAQQMIAYKQALCVLNIKRHAMDLARLLLQQADGDAVYHLSTSMCPAHRQSVLEEVRKRLRKGKHCLLVSTQCVEAGVDVDFPVVFRAFAPLDSIAQAAGRCNRNGKLAQGKVVLFVPEDEKYPRGAYEQAARVTRGYLKEAGEIDLYDPDFYDRYYRLVYDLASPDQLRRDLQEAIKALDFAEVARLYRLIPDSTINILVPYDRAMYEQLATEVRQRGLTSAWIRRARPYVVSTYRPRPSDDICQFLEPIAIRGQPSEEWFIYTEPSHYDRLLGLQPQQAPELWIL